MDDAEWTASRKCGMVMIRSEGATDRIGLEEAIRAVREELTAAMVAGAGEEIRFRVNAVHLDFNVVVSKEVEASGKVRFWVVDAGGGGKLGSASTHTIHVELDPATATGGPVEVRDRESNKPG